MKRLAVFNLSLLFFILVPFSAYASDVSIEKDLHSSLEKSRAVVVAIQNKLANSASVSDEIAQLKALAENIKASHSLLQERFGLRKEAVKSLGTKAVERHTAMSAGYRQALEEYLALVNSFQRSAISDQLQIIERLKTLLNRILPKKKKPIFGSLPYKNLRYPSKEPDTASPAIKPAYKGGNKTVSQDDLKDTDEAPISIEIATLAQSLNWNPVSIYEYVKNNIETEWYWGCMKGAEETLSQKSGNDCDQATLLAALMRASGFPTRYVRGTIEFFAGGRDGIPMELIKNLTGIEDPFKIAEFFQKAGIPYKPIIQGGKIANFQIEHIWVESQIPYANYRGAIIDEHGKTWLGLDTSIKVKGYTYNNPVDIFQVSGAGSQLAAIRDEYLGTSLTQTPLEYFKEKLIALSDQQSADSFKLTRTLIPEIMKILPASMQFDQKRITNEYTQIPEELKHKIKLSAISSQQSANSNQLFEITMNTMSLSNKQIAITYEPETVEDQQIIDSYGGLDNTPSYLIRLRPVLKIGDQRTAVGTDGLPMGSEYNLSIEFISPNGIEKITNTHIVGNLAVIGLVAQKAVSNQLSAVSSQSSYTESSELNAEGLLYQEASNYIDRWNKAEEELASLFHLSISRPLPTVVTLGGVIDVTYLLDIPHGFEWKGVFMDANMRAIETTTRTQSTDDRTQTFMELSGLQGSVLEHKVFGDDWQVASVSTANLFQYAQSNGVSTITIDKTNIASVLSTLPFDDNILDDIQNAVNQNLTIKIPQVEIVYDDWTGLGYIKENPETSEAGYMLSGPGKSRIDLWEL